MKKLLFVLFAFICANLRPTGFAFADPTPVPENSIDAAAKALDKAKDETQKLKDIWDRTRLEVTLYDQRAKRAYKKWAKAVKTAKEQARLQKERAELELALAIEKRKLAFNEWQAAQLRQAAAEARVKALDQEKDSAAIRDKIKKLEAKLAPAETPGHAEP